jgi:hypothetical protein
MPNKVRPLHESFLKISQYRHGVTPQDPKAVEKNGKGGLRSGKPERYRPPLVHPGSVFLD